MIFTKIYGNSSLSFGVMLMIGSIGYSIYVGSASLIGLITRNNKVLITSGVVIGGSIAGLSASLLYFSLNYYVALTNNPRLAGLSFMIIQSANLMGCIINWAFIHLI